MSGTKRTPTESLAPDTPLMIEVARLVYVREGKPDREVRLSGQPTIIGKERSVGLPINDPHVSHKHCQVTLTTEGVLVEDLGSRNGTSVNGATVERAVLVQNAVISIGKTDLRLEIGESEPVSDFHGALGISDGMQEVFRVLSKLAPTDVTIMLLGETGSGKDVLARAIHAASPRTNGPFAVFDCGAVAANLVESDLFGHTKGAFTGAVAERDGVFERGNTGTVFLDEIGELPRELQPRLLRVLEQRQVTRVGGETSIAIDVRVVAATNRDLERDVDAGRFRQDLFFRLSAAVVHIPPLRERLEDLPALVDSFVRDLGRPLTVSSATLAAFRSYDWPGNTRELRNVVESAAALADGDTLEPRHLMFFKRRGRAETLERLPLGGRTLEVLERAAIKQTLKQADGNKAKAARMLGIASSTLYEKIKKYDL